MLHPWAERPFELLLHGELHYRAGEDFDRRMALVSFDNAIEISITNYLGLNPILRRGNRTYPRDSVERWKTNFHSKLDFLELECSELQVEMYVERAHIVWCHDQRNDEYHQARASAPDRLVLEGIRRASLWVFEFLYDVPGVIPLLDERIAAMAAMKAPSPRTDEFDFLINAYCDEVRIGDFTFPPSEVLLSHDPEAYRALGLELREFSRPEETA